MSRPPLNLQIEIEGRLRRITLEAGEGDGHFRAILDSRAFDLEACTVQPGVLSLVIGNRAYRCVVHQGVEGSAIQIGNHRVEYRVEDPRSLTTRRAHGSSTGGIQIMKAPMPGRIVRLLVEHGETVVAHQGILVIEAMKMQNALKSSRAGKVVRIRVEPGAAVAAGEVLAEIE